MYNRDLEALSEAYLQIHNENLLKRMINDRLVKDGLVAAAMSGLLMLGAKDVAHKMSDYQSGYPSLKQPGPFDGVEVVTKYLKQLSNLKVPLHDKHIATIKLFKNNKEDLTAEQKGYLEQILKHQFNLQDIKTKEGKTIGHKPSELFAPSKDDVTDSKGFVQIPKPRA